jgi:hypothetical protein
MAGEGPSRATTSSWSRSFPFLAGPLAALFSAAELDGLWSLTCRPGHPAAARRAARLRRLLA